MASQSYELSTGLSIAIYSVLLFIAAILLILGIKAIMAVNRYAARIWQWFEEKDQESSTEKLKHQAQVERQKQSMLKEE